MSELPPWAQDVLTGLAPLLSREDAARILGVSTKTVDRAFKRGELQHLKLGDRVLKPRLLLVEFLIKNAKTGV